MSATSLDLTTDLHQLALLAADPSQVDELLMRALDYLAQLIPYDLAAVLELHGDELAVRCAAGPLADARVRRHRIHLRDHPGVALAMETRRSRVLLEADHAHGEGDPYDGVLDLPHGHSCMVVPLYAGDKTLGAITFDRSRCVRYEPRLVELAGVAGQIVALALAAAEQAALLDRYRRTLEERNRLLSDQVQLSIQGGPELTGVRSPAMKRLVGLAQQVAVTDTPVLITGETGVGKEVLARAIHGWSRRAAGPFVAINCAALPENLVESELFGHTKGAFSGAAVSRPGRFVVANGGTLLLDEIGELPLAAQSKLLRVLQEGTFEPVGSDRSVKVDVRILAATHVDLERAIAAGRFREDLYYRLQVFPLHLPPLRERREDLMELARHILTGLARRTGRGPWVLPPREEQRLAGWSWPGNVRELVNRLERATILQPAGELSVELPAARGRDAAAPGPDLRTLEQVERAHIEAVLAYTEGKLYGAGGAAEILDMKPSTLQSRMLKLGVERKGAVAGERR